MENRSVLSFSLLSGNDEQRGHFPVEFKLPVCLDHVLSMLFCVEFSVCFEWAKLSDLKL